MSYYNSKWYYLLKAKICILCYVKKRKKKLIKMCSIVTDIFYVGDG